MRLANWSVNEDSSGQTDHVQEARYRLGLASGKPLERTRDDPESTLSIPVYARSGHGTVAVAVNAPHPLDEWIGIEWQSSVGDCTRPSGRNIIGKPYDDDYFSDKLN